MTTPALIDRLCAACWARPRTAGRCSCAEPPVPCVSCAVIEMLHGMRAIMMRAASDAIVPWNGCARRVLADEQEIVRRWECYQRCERTEGWLVSELLDAKRSMWP